MKIQGKDFEVLRKVAEAGIERMKGDGLTLNSYLERDPRIPRIDKTKDLEMRYRWDCFYLGQRLNVGVRFASAKDHESGMGGGYNEIHIDTALKHVVRNYAMTAQMDQVSAVPALSDKQVERAIVREPHRAALQEQQQADRLLSQEQPTQEQEHEAEEEQEEQAAGRGVAMG